MIHYYHHSYCSYYHYENLKYLDHVPIELVVVFVIFVANANEYLFHAMVIDHIDVKMKMELYYLGYFVEYLYVGSFYHHVDLVNHAMLAQNLQYFLFHHVIHLIYLIIVTYDLYLNYYYYDLNSHFYYFHCHYYYYYYYSNYHCYCYYYNHYNYYRLPLLLHRLLVIENLMLYHDIEEYEVQSPYMMMFDSNLVQYKHYYNFYQMVMVEIHLSHFDLDHLYYYQTKHYYHYYHYYHCYHDYSYCHYYYNYHYFHLNDDVLFVDLQIDSYFDPIDIDVIVIHLHYLMRLMMDYFDQNGYKYDYNEYDGCYYYYYDYKIPVVDVLDVDGVGVDAYYQDLDCCYYYYYYYYYCHHYYVHYLKHLNEIAIVVQDTFEGQLVQNEQDSLKKVMDHHHDA